MIIGGDIAIPASVLASGELYLEISVEGETMSLRQRITATLFARDADRLQGKRLETGRRTLSINPAAAAKTIHVSFDRPFSSAPRVVVTDLDGLIGKEAFVRTRIYNVSELGFDVEWKSHSGAPAAGTANFGYQAFGE